jgi:hypothetical protein
MMGITFLQRRWHLLAAGQAAGLPKTLSIQKRRGPADDDQAVSRFQEGLTSRTTRTCVSQETRRANRLEDSVDQNTAVTGSSRVWCTSTVVVVVSSSPRPRSLAHRGCRIANAIDTQFVIAREPRH